MSLKNFKLLFDKSHFFGKKSEMLQTLQHSVGMPIKPLRSRRIRLALTCRPHADVPSSSPPAAPPWRYPPSRRVQRLQT
eukprot:763327-Hanusia_phi.AAC.7